MVVSSIMLLLTGCSFNGNKVNDYELTPDFTTGETELTQPRTDTQLPTDF